MSPARDAAGPVEPGASDLAEGALAYVGLGANLGDREAALDRAVEALHADAATRVVRVSPLYETDPVGGPAGQPRYLNGVAELRTTLDPEALLARLLAVEASLGRTRDVRWGPRALDLDLLLYGDRCLESPTLALPHPRLPERVFVLRPLCDLAPAVRVPRSDGGPGPTARSLLDALRYPSTMRVWRSSIRSPG